MLIRFTKNILVKEASAKQVVFGTVCSQN